MSDFGIIDKAVNILEIMIVLLSLCMYISLPFENEIANLNMIQILKEKYKCNVGYSGHEKVEN